MCIVVSGGMNAFSFNHNNPRSASSLLKTEYWNVIWSKLASCNSLLLFLFKKINFVNKQPKSRPIKIRLFNNWHFLKLMKSVLIGPIPKICYKLPLEYYIWIETILYFILTIVIMSSTCILISLDTQLDFEFWVIFLHLISKWLSLWWLKSLENHHII